MHARLRLYGHAAVDKVGGCLHVSSGQSHAQPGSQLGQALMQWPPSQRARVDAQCGQSSHNGVCTQVLAHPSGGEGTGQTAAK